jgi:hypothetical protein
MLSKKPGDKAEQFIAGAPLSSPTTGGKSTPEVDELVSLNVQIPRSLRTWVKVMAAQNDVKIPAMILIILEESKRRYENESK